MQKLLAMSSPRPWGCFIFPESTQADASVFPTPVGVFPPSVLPDSAVSGLPHARGGVSAPVTISLAFSGSSPRPWGCFSVSWKERFRQQVFPTPVGVFLMRDTWGCASIGLPHARGGVSMTWIALPPQFRSSPRPWGCFCASAAGQQWPPVFPTPVGVFLHAPLDFDSRAVFPTPVGVFLGSWLPRHALRSLPHARGGVSPCAWQEGRERVSSPRPWGCFRHQVPPRIFI